MRHVFEDEINLNLREDNTLEIYAGNQLAAEISDGRLDMDFVKEVLEDLDYRVDEKSLAMREIQDGEQIYSYSKASKSICRQALLVICVEILAQATKSSFPLGLTTGGI